MKIQLMIGFSFLNCILALAQLTPGGGGGGGSGTVSSVGLTLPSMFAVDGSPITTSGTLAGTLNTTTANFGLMGPSSGSAAAPTFRALVASDVPATTWGSITGTLSSQSDLNTQLGLKAPLASPQFTGGVLFGTDNSFDIGAQAATRPRSAYVGTNLYVGKYPNPGSGGAGYINLLPGAAGVFTSQIEMTIGAAGVIDIQYDGVGLNAIIGHATDLFTFDQNNFQFYDTGNVAIAAINTTGVAVKKIGLGLSVKEGTNGKQGVCTLASGTCTVTTTSVTASSRIFITAQDSSSTGALGVSARTAGTSFVITSSNIVDSGVVAYEIFEPG